MSGGFIKLHRQIIGWEWFHNSAMVHLWLYLLLRANHADNRWQGIEIKRGQLVTGRKQISKDTGLSERTIRTCINRLKSTGHLSVKTTNKFSIINILNYDKYQDRNFENDQQNDQQAVTPATSNRPQTRRIKKDKKKEKTPCAAVAERFGRFWDSFPKKVKKKDALKAWEKISPDEPLFDQIMTGLDAAKRSEQWNKDGGQYIPHPATWLNGERWTDEYNVGGLPPFDQMRFKDTPPANSKQASARELLSGGFLNE